MAGDRTMRLRHRQLSFAQLLSQGSQRETSSHPSSTPRLVPLCRPFAVLLEEQPQLGCSCRGWRNYTGSANQNQPLNCAQDAPTAR